MLKQGFALVLDDGTDTYKMSSVHQTAECAVKNGLGPFGCLSGTRVVAVVPVNFEDDGKINLHDVFGDQEAKNKAIYELTV